MLFYLVLGQDLNTPRIFNFQFTQIIDHGLKIYDAPTNLPARGSALRNLPTRSPASTNLPTHSPASTNLPAHNPTLWTSPPVVQHT